MTIAREGVVIARDPALSEPTFSNPAKSCGTEHPVRTHGETGVFKCAVHLVYATVGDWILESLTRPS